MNTRASDFLLGLLNRQLDEKQREWLSHQVSELQADPSDSNLHIALGMTPRRLGKSDLRVNAADVQAGAQIVDGWDLTGWSVPDAARATMMSVLPDDGPEFASRFKALYQTADIAESVALFRALPLYPDPAALEDAVGEGLRTNMKAVFEAIAHRNPYPRTQFDAHRWNHMVLKALFIDSRLAPIQGLDERANPELSQIMRDFAHERWAAGRAVPFEIWRCVGPFADDDDALADLQRVIDNREADNPDVRSQQAGVLALAASNNDKAAQMLQTVPDLAAQVASGELSWKNLGL